MATYDYWKLASPWEDEEERDYDFNNCCELESSVESCPNEPCSGTTEPMHHPTPNSHDAWLNSRAIGSAQ